MWKSIYTTMSHHYQEPHEHLAEVVRTVLVMVDSSETSPDSPPIFTNGMPALLCSTEKNSSASINLFGSSIPAHCWSLKEGTTLIAYFFKPFTLSCLFKLSNQKISTSPVGLDSWNPHKFNALKTQLIYTNTIEQNIEVLDHFLIQQLKENKEIHEIVRYATDKILCNPNYDILPELLKELNLNERTFQRIFKKYVGITPTQYRRICQFQFSFDQLRSNEFDKMSDIAFDHGFSDQSHFIRAFKEFTNITPNDYLQNGLTGENL